MALHLSTEPFKTRSGKQPVQGMNERMFNHTSAQSLHRLLGVEPVQGCEH